MTPVSDTSPLSYSTMMRPKRFGAADLPSWISVYEDPDGKLEPMAKLQQGSKQQSFWRRRSKRTFFS